jgi:hypothetical protein
VFVGVTVIGNNREVPTPVDGTEVVTVTYHNVTEPEVESVVKVSSFCFQPVKYDCYNTLVSHGYLSSIIHCKIRQI